jgi:hypothetical protein
MNILNLIVWQSVTDCKVYICRYIMLRLKSSEYHKQWAMVWFLVQQLTLAERFYKEFSKSSVKGDKQDVNKLSKLA